MSAARYTFDAPSLGEEITVCLTLPDTLAAEREDGLYPACVLVSPSGREADFWLRAFPLEALSRPPWNRATISLPARILSFPHEEVTRFLSRELPALAQLFKLSILQMGVADAPKESAMQALRAVGVPVVFGLSDPQSLLPV